MSWLIKIAFNFLSWFSFLFLVVYDRTKSKDTLEEMEPIKTFSSISKPHVKVSDPIEVSKKLHRMFREGPKTLQIISDFDNTLTKPNLIWQPGSSSLEIFQSMEEVPEWYKNEMEDLFSRFDTLFKDQTITVKEKELICQQYISIYTDRLKRLQVENIPKLIAREATRTFKLRDGTDKTFNLLEDSFVSVTVLSAGLGDVITAVFQNNNINVESVRIIGNFLKLKNGRIVGFLDDLISVFNKSEIAAKLMSKELELRQNIIVLGDALPDAKMADGAPPTANTLTIGFLNHDSEKLLDVFTRTFDIVIVKDFTMSVINEMLQEILQPVSSK